MRKNFIIVFLSLLLVVLLILLFVGRKESGKKQQEPSVKDQKADENPFKTAEIRVEVIESENNTFGYHIIVDGSPMIIQPNKPGLPGNEGFKTREHASKVGDLVVAKIKKGIMPPTVTLDELKELGVI